MNLLKAKLKLHQQKILIATVSAVAVSVISSPTLATVYNNISLKSSIFGVFDADIAAYLEYVRAIKDFYQAVADGNLERIFGEIAVNSGELGIPIHTEVKKAIDITTTQIDEQLGGFGLESAILGKVLQAEADYKLTRSGAETLLSQDGQRRIADLKEMTAQASTASAQAAQAAQSMKVTQDVQKQIALQNTSMTAILKSIYDSTVDGQVASIQAYQAIGNMSKVMAEESWGKRVTNQASQVGLLDTTAQFSALASPRINR